MPSEKRNNSQRPSVLKTWSKENMLRAVDAVRDDNMSISKASSNYEVPRTTLSDILNGKTSIDAKIGRRPALSYEEEEALVRYVTYMAEKRYPVTRTQVIGLGWAIALQHGKTCFSESGPTLKWWRGFKKRHPELTLRKSESVEKGRVTNATSDIIEEYFSTLADTLNEHGIADKPHLIYNCDEAGISLNKSTQKVLVPVSHKRCHALMKGTSSHISVLCCINAAGSNIPPLIIFKKGLPAGRAYVQSGPLNATYSSSDSGFIDQEMYTEWFEKNFLRFASSERPLILLQDGASAHFSPKLIDLAISNNVVLLCFPPKLTHILQPCDVGVYRRMKSELSKTMHQLKMLRGDVWVAKQNFPAVFKQVLENTMSPGIVAESFRKCGIYPLNKDIVVEELIRSGYISEAQKSLSVTAPNSSERKIVNDTLTNEQQGEKSSDDGTCIAEVEVEFSNIDNEEVQKGEILLTQTNDSVQPCPPELALKALEQSLTPKKQQMYAERFTDTRDGNVYDDPVYSTWNFLKRKVDGLSPSIPLDACSNPLVKAGVVPGTLANILSPPSKVSHRVTKRGTTKTRVLTGDEIQKEIKEKETKKKELEAAKKNRQKSKDTNVRQTKRKKLKLDSCDISDRQKRETFFSTSLGKMAKASNFSDLQNICEAMENDIENFKCSFHLPITSKLTVDEVSSQLLADADPSLKPVKTTADGNCLPRTGSILMFGNEDNHVEMRVRIVRELALHASIYLTDSFLANGATSYSKSISRTYAMFSQMFPTNTKMTKSCIRTLYEKEALNCTMINSYMGAWQIHALSSVLGVRLKVHYPGKGGVQHDLNRTINPRELLWDTTLTLMWTHTTNGNRSTWWYPNHFVPLFPVAAVENPQTDGVFQSTNTGFNLQSTDTNPNSESATSVVEDKPHVRSATEHHNSGCSDDKSPIRVVSEDSRCIEELSDKIVLENNNISSCTDKLFAKHSAADNYDSICPVCKWKYGDPKDPLKQDEWPMCIICEKWYHATCAEQHGILDDDDTFTCENCLK